MPKARKASNTKKTSSKNKTLKTKAFAKTQTKSANEDWLSIRAFVLLAIVFIIVEIVGLLTAKSLFLQGLAGAAFGSDINDISNAIYLFVAIMIMTIIILVLLRLRKTRNVLWIVEAMAIFFTSTIVFGAIFPTNDWLVLIITILILAWRYTHRGNILFRDFVGIIAICGAGSFIGISLGLAPILAFVIALALYDIIAVFYTKHMVTIGREVVKKNFAFTIALPTKKHTFELGNGDLVIPLVVASSILVNGPFRNNSIIAGLCMGASFIGLMSSIYIVSKKKIALPALPPQTALMVIIIIAAMLLGL